MKITINRERLLYNTCFAMSIILKGALFVPLLTISDTAFYGWAEDGWLWAYIAVVAVTALFGVLCGRGAIRLKQHGKKKRADLVRTQVYLIGTGLCALGVWLIHGISFASGVAFILITITFFRCAAAAKVDYKDNFSGAQIIVFAGIYLGTIAAEAILRNFFDFNLNRSPMIICLIICCGCIAVLLNQRNIDVLTSKRRKNALPEKVRTSNLRMVLIIFGILLVSYIFRQQVVDIAEFILYYIWRCIYWILRGFFAFLGWIGKTEVFPVGDGGGSGGGIGLPEAEAKEHNGIWIMILMLAAIVIFAIVKLGPGWVKAIREKLAELWKMLIAWLSRFAERMDSSGSEYFSDSEENLDMTAEEKQVIISKRAERRKLKNARRRYDGTTGSERIREGYKLMLEVLKYKEIPASEADTAGEIPKKIEKQELAQQYAAAAPVYDKVRYGKKESSTEETSSFDEAVNKAFADAMSGKR